MTNEDKIEFKSYIHDAIAGYHAKVDAQNTITNNRLETINAHLEKQNSRIGKAESAIALALEERAANRQQQQQYRDTVDELEERVDELAEKELTHIINCPVSPKLRNIEDKLLGQQSVRKYMAGLFAGGMALGGLIIGILKLILG